MIQENVCNSDIDVSVALESYLDKVCTMLEYAGYTDYTDDLIAEMFDVYLEATDRRKKADEIDKNLADNAIADVKSKSPQKARQARQVRNFLMTQDFDPKTKTIKSDYKDENGKNPRTYLIPNAYEDTSTTTSNNNRLIGLTNETLKGKAANRALITSHEKGHDVFSRNGKHTQWAKGDKNDDDNKNERGIKFINNAIANGKKINDHDSGEYIVDKHNGDGYSPEELEADLHAAKNARVRTKYAGNKKAVKRSGATRNINDNEIEKFYINLQKIIDRPLATAKSICKTASRNIEIYKQCIKLSSIIDEIRNKDPNEINVDEYMSIIKNYDMSVTKIDKSNTFLIKLYEDLGSQLKNVENEIKNINNMPNNEINYQQLESLINDYKDLYRSYHGFEKDVVFNMDFIYKYIIHIYNYLKTIRNGGSTVIPKLPDSEVLRKNVENLIKNSENKEAKIAKLKDRLSESKKRLHKWYNDNKNLKPDDSTQMRHDFVK